MFDSSNNFDFNFATLDQSKLETDFDIVPNANKNYELSSSSFTLRCFGTLNPDADPTSTTGKITVK